MKPIRAKTDEELHKRVNEIDLEIAKFRAGMKYGGKMISIPTGPHDGVRWGIYQKLKKEKSRILSVLNERFHKRMSIRKKPRRRSPTRRWKLR